ncbi:MAG: hypothetical protein ED556_14510 [Winogradskyella sp.]|uniref:hypothetical protein n=1 Tax=Winogradskyella sp. TaxID=1883156 RepID=UPI000F3D2ED0|nr:hypothetical protein [Winogradskyella sp.]RNC79786.1 MAG: hypothetical protein ED556_14510 [Winogradskyella sp.]
MKTFRLLILLFSTVVLCACSSSEDESTPNLIQESIGDYTYTGWFYSGTNWSDRQDINGNLTVSRNGDNTIITIDGDQEIEISRVVFSEQSPKYGFDIESATIIDNNNNSINRFGWGDMIMESQPYDGLYDNDLEFFYVTFIKAQTSEPDTHFYIQAEKN